MSRARQVLGAIGFRWSSFFLLPLAITIIGALQEVVETIRLLAALIRNWQSWTSAFWGAVFDVIPWPLSIGIDYVVNELNILVFVILSLVVSRFQKRMIEPVYGALPGPAPVRLSATALVALGIGFILVPAVAMNEFVLLDPSVATRVLAQWPALVSIVIWIVVIVYANNHMSRPLLLRGALALLALGVAAWFFWQYWGNLAPAREAGIVITEEFERASDPISRSFLRANVSALRSGITNLTAAILALAVVAATLLPPRTLTTYIQVLALVVTIILLSWGLDSLIGWWEGVTGEG